MAVTAAIAWTKGSLSSQVHPPTQPPELYRTKYTAMMRVKVRDFCLVIHNLWFSILLSAFVGMLKGVVTPVQIVGRYQ